MFGKRSIDKSLEIWNRGKKLIPLGTQTASKGPNQYVYGVHPIYLDSGDGCIVKDVDGNKYIDHVCALGPIILGYNNKRTIKAVTKQLKKGSTFSLMHPLEVELAELLVDIIPSAEQVRFAKNGTDVTLAAVRLARSYTGRDHILKPTGHYSGFGDWTAAATDRDFGVPGCLKELVETFPYNNLEALEEKLQTGKFAALIMEPIQQEAPKEGFFEGVRELCTKYKTILIFDEMITGFRWALGGVQEYYNVDPDISTFGKALANGMPISAIVGKEEYMNEFNKIFFSMTFGGEACSLAAAVETIKELKEKRLQIYPHIWEQGTRLQVAFNEHAKMLGLDAEMTGQAPWHNTVFRMEDGDGFADLFRQEMVKRGILFGRAIVTTWAHKSHHIDKTTEAIKGSLSVVSEAMNNGGADKYLEGHRSQAIFSPRNFKCKK
jgi:glutamate-1-semialdehyde aminotransferase